MSRATVWTPQLWQDTFDQLLNDELDNEDQWSLNFNYTLTDKLTKEEKKRGWKVCKHQTFGNFRCASCSKTWFSARVGVLFHYRLQRDRGTVIMRPFGQACRDCDDDDKVFRRPGFSNEVVKRALSRLLSKIRKNCYGEADNNDHGSAHTVTRRTKPHEKTLCEACIQGSCGQDED